MLNYNSKENIMKEKLDVLAFGAHPDDVELMCGATVISSVQKGHRVGVISLTAGELGTRGNALQRAREFDESARIMGIAMHKALDIPDGDIELNYENRIKVIREIRTYRPKIVFAPYWETRHPDHAHCSHLVREAVFYAGLGNIDTAQRKFRPSKVIYYSELFDFHPSFIVDVSHTFEGKMEAIKAYKSQVFNPDAKSDEKERTLISSPEFMEMIIARGKFYGAKIGAKYGEPFFIREPLKVKDPMTLF